MTKNEASNLPKCLASAAAFDEVFVVDSGSTDGTQAIARAAGATVVDFQWNGRYPKKKQWCLENVPFGHDWVLYLDADEELTPAVVAELRLLARRGFRKSGYFVGYDYVFLGRRLRHGLRVYKLVLFDRRRGRFRERDDLAAANMWEVEGHYQPHVEGETGVLRNRMLHDDHDRLFHYFDRHNRYSDWEAVLDTMPAGGDTQLARRGRLKRAFARLPFRPLWIFLYSYVVAGGALDGSAGFHYALSRTFYYWQVGLKQDERARGDAHARAAG
jgi:glycosyltransferase involved in cell wall biosynthesis